MSEGLIAGSPAFNQATLDAMAKANMATAKGVASLAGYLFETARQSFEDAVALNRTLMSIKTPTELAEFQTKLAQDSIVCAVERGKALSELTTSIARDVTASFGEAAALASDASARRKSGATKNS